MTPIEPVTKPPIGVTDGTGMMGRPGVRRLRDEARNVRAPSRGPPVMTSMPLPPSRRDDHPIVIS